MRELIRLVSSAGTGHFYTTDKNKRTKPEKIEIKKYDPVVRQHVIYKEAGPMNEQPDQGRVKGMEARLFLFLVICLFPLLSVALVGGFGFCVWMYQLLAGPPGPPA